MNGIEKITARIADDAESEITQIRAEGQEAADKITAAYKAESDELVRVILEKGQKTAAERKERLINMAQMESKKAVLAAKQEVLDKAFDGALKKLTELPENDMIKLLSELAAKSSVSGKEVIVFSEKHKKIAENAVKAANKILADSGKTAELTMSEKTSDINGGFLLSDGNVEVNCAFETLVRLSKSTAAGQAAKVLFG